MTFYLRSPTLDNSVKPTNDQYYALFQRDPVGVAILDQLGTLFYDSQTFDTDPYQHAFNAGRREVVRYILNRCVVPTPTEGDDE